MSFSEAYKQLLEGLRALPASAAKERAIEKLEESAFWASAAVSGVSSPIDHVTGDDAPKKPFFSS